MAQKLRSTSIAHHFHHFTPLFKWPRPHHPRQAAVGAAAPGPSREGRRPSPPSWEGRGKPSVLSIEFAWQVLKDLMTWYYHGKDIPIAKLPVRAILAEWYEVCNEDGISVRPQRAAPKGNRSCGSSSSSSVPLPQLT